MEEYRSEAFRNATRAGTVKIPALCLIRRTEEPKKFNAGL